MRVLGAPGLMACSYWNGIPAPTIRRTGDADGGRCRSDWRRVEAGGAGGLGRRGRAGGLDRAGAGVCRGDRVVREWDRFGGGVRDAGGRAAAAGPRGGGFGGAVRSSVVSCLAGGAGGWAGGYVLRRGGAVGDCDFSVRGFRDPAWACAGGGADRAGGFAAGFGDVGGVGSVGWGYVGGVRGVGAGRKRGSAIYSHRTYARKKHNQIKYLYFLHRS